MPRTPLQSIDLFAGCGGLSTGLHLAVWKGLFAVARNPAAFSTLKANLVDQRGHFSWPDWFEFKGPYTTGGKLRVLQTPRSTQVGNAVSPLFATIAGLALKNALGHG